MRSVMTCAGPVTLAQQQQAAEGRRYVTDTQGGRSAGVGQPMGGGAKGERYFLRVGDYPGTQQYSEPFYRSIPSSYTFCPVWPVCIRMFAPAYLQIASSAAGLKLPKDANPPMMLLRLRCTEAGMITRTHNDSL